MSLQNKEKNDDEQTYVFKVPYVDFSTTGDLGESKLQKLIGEKFSKLLPVNEQSDVKKLPDSIKWALMALAVVIASQVGSCIRNNYEIQERIKVEKGYSN